MTRWALILLLPFALACGGGENDDNNSSSAGNVSGIDSPTSNATGADCLAGTWEMDVASSYNMESVNAMMAEEGSDMVLEYSGSSGSAAMILNGDGSAEYRLNNLEVTINADSPMGQMTVTNTMNGSTTGVYSLDGDAMRFSDGDGTLTMNSAVTFGGRQMSNSSSDIESVFDMAASTRMTFQCTRDELLLNMHESTEGGRQVFEDMRFVRTGGA